MKKIILAVMLLFGSLAFAKSEYKVITPAPLASSKIVMMELLEISSTGDRELITASIFQYILEGRCDILEKGTKVKIIKTDLCNVIAMVQTKDRKYGWTLTQCLE